jgi:Na+/melibiose symporter-like transporter
MKLNLIFSFLLMFFQEVGGIDAGEAINSLRQNNAVVGILYFIVVVEAVVIIVLWRHVNSLQKERVEDLKARITAEEDLRKEIQDIYTELNVPKKNR